ncbi:MAG: LapA family protein [Acidimicrobiales bacterium]
MARSSKGADGSPLHKRGNRDIARLVVYGVGLLLLIAFILRNSTPATVDFLVFHTHASLIWVILISAVLGVFVDRLAIAIAKRRKKQ